MSEQSTTTEQIDALLDSGTRDDGSADVMIHRHNGAVYAYVVGVPGSIGRGQTIAEAVADCAVMAATAAARKAVRA